MGASFGAGLLEADADLVKRNFDLNLHQAMSVTRHGANVMAKSGGGTIVLVGSVSGISSLPNQIIYGSAKAALHHFVRCAAAELGHLGVRINAVAPGYDQTERMIERFPAESCDEIADKKQMMKIAVGAIAEIHHFINELAEQGIAVVVISSYPPEMLAVSDRILVARQGKIVEDMEPQNATEEAIMYAAVH